MNILSKNITIYITVLFFLLASCQNSPNNKSTEKDIPKSGALSVADFEKQLSVSDHPQLIDVRTEEEFKDGHLKGAQNINWNSENFEAEAMKLDKDKPVFVYCLSGSRSKAAAEALTGKGFKIVYDMEGGYLAWTRAEKSVEKDPEAAKTGITHDEYIKMVTADNLVLVDFNAPWCGPCKKLSPILNDVEKDMNGKLKVVKINIDDNQELASKLSIENIPAIYVYKGGKLVWQQVGLIGKKELTEALGKL